MRKVQILLLQLPLDSLEGSGHFISFLNHQIVLHPEQMVLGLKGSHFGRVINHRSLAGSWGGPLLTFRAPLRPQFLCPLSVLFP